MKYANAGKKKDEKKIKKCLFELPEHPKKLDM